MQNFPYLESSKKIRKLKLTNNQYIAILLDFFKTYYDEEYYFIALKLINNGVLNIVNCERKGFEKPSAFFAIKLF